MDFQQEADIIRSLGNIAANGHLHKGLKPVHWCMDCASALAEAEVEYEDKQSHAVDVAFAVKDLADFAQRAGLATVPNAVDFVIWTTTPWTLPANQAVSLHPELVYVVVQADIAGQTRILVLAQALYEATLVRYQAENIHVLAEVVGQAFEHVALQHPFYERVVPVIVGEHVTADAGTGAVHTAPVTAKTTLSSVKNTIYLWITLWITLVSFSPTRHYLQECTLTKPMNRLSKR